VHTWPKQRFFINRNAKITEGNAIQEQLKYLILVGFRKPNIAIAYNDEKDADALCCPLLFGECFICPK
jgi:hypothetical protein